MLAFCFCGNKEKFVLVTHEHLHRMTAANERECASINYKG